MTPNTFRRSSREIRRRGRQRMGAWGWGGWTAPEPPSLELSAIWAPSEGSWDARLPLHAP